MIAAKGGHSDVVTLLCDRGGAEGGFDAYYFDFDALFADVSVCMHVFLISFV